MRSRICHGLIVLALLSACETVPETGKVDIGGHSFELKKKPAAPEPVRDAPR